MPELAPWIAPGVVIALFGALIALFGALFVMYRATMEARIDSVEKRADSAELRLEEHARRLLSCEDARSDLARTNVELNKQLMQALLQMTHIVDKSTTDKGA